MSYYACLPSLPTYRCTKTAPEFRARILGFCLDRIWCVRITQFQQVHCTRARLGHSGNLESGCQGTKSVAILRCNFASLSTYHRTNTMPECRAASSAFHLIKSGAWISTSSLHSCVSGDSGNLESGQSSTKSPANLRCNFANLPTYHRLNTTPECRAASWFFDLIESGLWDLHNFNKFTALMRVWG